MTDIDFYNSFLNFRAQCFAEEKQNLLGFWSLLKNLSCDNLESNNHFSNLQSTQTNLFSTNSPLQARQAKSNLLTPLFPTSCAKITNQLEQDEIKTKNAWFFDSRPS